MTLEEFVRELKKRGYLRAMDGAVIRDSDGGGYEFAPIGEMAAALLLEAENESHRLMGTVLDGRGHGWKGEIR